MELNTMTMAKRVKKTVPLSRGLEEVKNLKILNGIRGVPGLLDYQVGDGIIHLYTQYIEGTALSKSTGSFDALFADGLKVLNAIHARRIWHRDICPRHLLVDETGSISLIDFGSATAEEKQDSVIGTVAYAAPEVLFDPIQYNASSDVFAYAKSFYSCFGNAIASLQPHHMNVLSKAMALNQEARFQSAEALLSAYMRAL
jgi:serine/threonine protein kinase